MKKRNLIIRIVAIILCALLILGVVTAALSAFAYDAATLPATGSNPAYIWVAVAGVLALVIAVVCVVTSKKSKN